MKILKHKRIALFTVLSDRLALRLHVSTLFLNALWAHLYAQAPFRTDLYWNHHGTEDLLGWFVANVTYRSHRGNSSPHEIRYREFERFRSMKPFIPEHSSRSKRSMLLCKSTVWIRSWVTMIKCHIRNSCFVQGKAPGTQTHPWMAFRKRRDAW